MFAANQRIAAGGASPLSTCWHTLVRAMTPVSRAPALRTCITGVHIAEDLASVATACCTDLVSSCIRGAASPATCRRYLLMPPDAAMALPLWYDSPDPETHIASRRWPTRRRHRLSHRLAPPRPCSPALSGASRLPTAKSQNQGEMKNYASCNQEAQ